MKALGKKRMTALQRNTLDSYIKREVQRQYDKEIDNAENFSKFFTTIVACEVLEEEFGFGETRRKRFLDKFVEHCNSLSNYLESNTCFEKNSNTPIFDKEYNLEIMNRYAEKFGIKFDDGMIEY